MNLNNYKETSENKLKATTLRTTIDWRIDWLTADNLDYVIVIFYKEKKQNKKAMNEIEWTLEELNEKLAQAETTYDIMWLRNEIKKQEKAFEFASFEWLLLQPFKCKVNEKQFKLFYDIIHESWQNEVYKILAETWLVASEYFWDWDTENPAPQGKEYIDIITKEINGEKVTGQIIEQHRTREYTGTKRKGE